MRGENPKMHIKIVFQKLRIQFWVHLQKCREMENKKWPPRPLIVNYKRFKNQSVTTCTLARLIKILNFREIQVHNKPQIIPFLPLNSHLRIAFLVIHE